MSTIDPFRLLVALAQDAVLRRPADYRHGKLGELAVGIHTYGDPDAIGVVEWHGFAAEDAAGPAFDFDDPFKDRDADAFAQTREVWDIAPLNPAAKLNEHGVQRWENVDFVVVPADVVKRAGGLADGP